MTAAHRDVAVVPPDFDLRSLAHGPAIRADTQVHDGFASTMADRFQFDEIVCQCEQRRAAREKLCLKVGAQAVAKNGNTELVGNVGELLHLRSSEKLGLVDEHTS